MIEWILTHNGTVVYLILFLLLLGGAVGLPIPEDLPLIAGGIYVYQRPEYIFEIFIVCYFGIVAGDLIIFHAGKKFGPALFKAGWFKHRMPAEKLAKLRERLQKRSLLMIFIARHLFYLRSITFLICGAVNMELSRFLIADLIAALVSAPLMLSLGYSGAHHYKDILLVLSQVKTWSLMLGLVVLLLFFIYLRRRQKVKQKIGTEEPSQSI